jgi:hypothetical protein
MREILTMLARRLRLFTIGGDKMAALIISILFLAAVIGLSVGIGFLCLEFVVRLIGRALGVEFGPKGVIQRGTIWH